MELQQKESKHAKHLGTSIRTECPEEYGNKNE